MRYNPAKSKELAIPKARHGEIKLIDDTPKILARNNITSKDNNCIKITRACISIAQENTFKIVKTFGLIELNITDMRKTLIINLRTLPDE